MRFQNPIVNKFWRFSTSFQLGIPVLVALAILITTGTIIESKYDAYAAQQLIYRSWMMYVTMGLLIYNLAIVMVDRLPWKKRHAPFLLVHIGIIVLILGGYITQKFGIDGTMMIPLNGKNSLVTLPETDLVVYATFTGDSYTKFYEKEVDFFNHPPKENQPYVIPLGDDRIQILKYVKYARVSRKIISSQQDQAGASVKIQLQNARVKQIETLTQSNKTKSADVNLGPLKIYLGHDLKNLQRKNPDRNEVYLNAKSADEVQYALYNKLDAKPYKTGLMKIGDVVPTAWMGLEIRLIDYLPQATEEWDVTEVERPTPLTTAAVQIQFRDKKHWVLLNDVVKLFGDQVAYLMSYQNRRLETQIDVALLDFKVARYEGTQKAKGYQSRVRLTMKPQAAAGAAVQAAFPLQIEQDIQMNEPLKFAGFTFYQSSYNEDERTGEITDSVLSVNYDPGRWIKYIGSLIMSVGIVWFFIQNRKRKTAL